MNPNGRFRYPTARPDPRVEPRLTPRQREVWAMVADGLCTKEIAAALGVSFSTAKKHREALNVRTGVSDPVRMCRLAIRWGVVSEPVLKPEVARELARRCALGVAAPSSAAFGVLVRRFAAILRAGARGETPLTDNFLQPPPP